MSQVVSGTFIADGNASDFPLDVDIGFVPDYLELFELTSTAEVVYRHYRCLEDAETTGQYGLEDDGAGVISACADADNGFTTWDGSKDSLVLIPDPINGELVPVPVTGDYTTTIGTNALARSATNIGTVIRPSAAAHNGYVYECTVAGTSSSEPTWETTPGAVTSDNDVRYICREENIVKGSGRGFTIGKVLNTDSDHWVFKAERHDRMGNMGDAAAGDPITFP